LAISARTLKSFDVAAKVHLAVRIDGRLLAERTIPLAAAF
jgi:hypothetical protein